VLQGGTAELRMTDSEFRMFCELIKSRCGLHFDEDSRFIVEKRLARRVEECGLGSFASYHLLLRDHSAGDEEFSNVVDTLTTNETYFFREYGQLRALMDDGCIAADVVTKEIEKLGLDPDKPNPVDC